MSPDSRSVSISPVEIKLKCHSNSVQPGETLFTEAWSFLVAVWRRTKALRGGHIRSRASQRRGVNSGSMSFDLW
jgi:hypothetical protein